MQCNALKDVFIFVVGEAVLSQLSPFDIFFVRRQAQLRLFPGAVHMGLV